MSHDEDGDAVGEICSSKADFLPSNFTVAEKERENLVLLRYRERECIQENENE